ncbi:scamp-domain-containing protein [Histomonas meleagridis]|uniref:scamp-domain-containing protein n=1 Tax=Histomonas meleagridis TaxID=135588 RepID=UPI00355A3921|nr:scamp-domain-containing protein [Histomonas meleagridis]KAH0801597.1 scamp-domain-containing protein [Histomonas meleagridis]
MSKLEERYYAIQQKEEELLRREKALKKENIEIVENEKQFNFPSFYPVMYHDISEEIPIISQWVVRIAYYKIYALFVTVIVNLIACCVSGKIKVGGAGARYNTGTNVVFGVIIGVLAVPLAFKINYHKLYNHCKENNIGLGWFALQGLYIFCYGYAAVGLKNTGLMGIITMIDAIAAGEGTFTKIICALSGIMWTVGALVQIFLFGRVMVLFRSTGERVHSLIGNEQHNDF